MLNQQTFSVEQVSSPKKLYVHSRFRLLRGILRRFLLIGVILLLVLSTGTYCFHEYQLHQNQLDLVKRLQWVKIRQKQYLITLGRNKHYFPSEGLQGKYTILESMRTNPLDPSLGTDHCGFTDQKRTDREYHQLLTELKTPSNGYQFTYISVSGTNSTRPTYQLNFYPTTPTGFFRSGTDCYYLDQTGVIRHSTSPTVLANGSSPSVE